MSASTEEKDLRAARAAYGTGKSAWAAMAEAMRALAETLEGAAARFEGAGLDGAVAEGAASESAASESAASESAASESGVSEGARIDAAALAAARARLDASRGIRARIARMQQVGALSSPVPAEALASVQAIRADTPRVREAEGRIARAFARLDATAPADDDERAERLIDRGLPGAWDLDLDLAITVGPRGVPLARALARRGCERVMLIVPPEQAGPELGALPPTVLVASDLDQAAAVLFGLQGRMPARLSYLELESSEALAAARKKLDDTARMLQVSTTTQSYFGARWAKQCIGNLPGIARATPASALAGKLAGVPAFIVCPGPSLAQNLGCLREVRGKGVILAVSHALHALERAGIVPDMGFAVDPQEAIVRHFEGVDLSPIPAVGLAVSVDERLYRLPTARRFVSFTVNPAAESWVGELVGAVPSLDTGGTVAHAATMAALEWGCDPIVFVGQDLAYSGGRMYAQGSLDQDLAVQVVQRSSGAYAAEGETVRRLMEVKAWSGEGTVHTSLQFHLFRLWYEGLVETRPQSRFVNCTEGGAHIEGMEHRPLAGLVASLPERGVSFEQLLASVSREAEGPARAREALARIAPRVKGLEETARLAKRCLQLLEESRRRGARSGTAEALARAEHDLKSRARPLTELSTYLQMQLLQATASARDLRRYDDAVEASRLLFDETAKACRVLLGAYEGVRKDLDALAKEG